MSDKMKLRETMTPAEWAIERRRLLNLLHDYQKKYDEHLNTAAIKDNEYRKEYSKTLLLKRTEGIQVTILKDVCRGIENVSEPRYQRDIAEGKAKAAYEKINILKRELDITENEIAAIRMGR